MNTLTRPTAGRIGAFGLDATRQGVAPRRSLTYKRRELRMPYRLTGAIAWRHLSGA